MPRMPRGRSPTSATAPRTAVLRGRSTPCTARGSSARARRPSAPRPPARPSRGARRRRSRVGPVRLLALTGRAAEDLGDHAEVAVGREIGERDAVVRAAEEHVMPAVAQFDERGVVVLYGDADVVDARTVLGEESCVHAVAFERLDELPLDAAYLRKRELPRVPDRLAGLVHAFHVVGVEVVHGP